MTRLIYAPSRQCDLSKRENLRMQEVRKMSTCVKLLVPEKISLAAVGISMVTSTAHMDATS